MHQVKKYLVYINEATSIIFRGTEPYLADKMLAET